MKNRSRLVQIIFGLLLVAAGVVLGILLFYKGRVLPESASTDAIYRAAEELGMTPQEFDQRRTLASVSGNLVVSLVEDGADPFSVVKSVMDHAERYRTIDTLFIGLAVTLISLVGVGIIAEALFSNNSETVKIREKRKNEQKIGQARARQMGTLAAYLDEGIKDNVGWSMPEPGESWKGSEGLEDYFGDKEHKVTLSEDIPQWYWEMLEGELSIHVMKRLDAIMYEYSHKRLDALKEYFHTIADQSADKDSALDALVYSLSQMDVEPKLATNAIQITLKDDDERISAMTDMLRATADWKDVLDAVRSNLNDPDDTLPPEGEDYDGPSDSVSDNLSTSETVADSDIDEGPMEPENLDEIQLSDIEIPVHDSKDSEEEGVEREMQLRELYYALGLRSLLDGMMTDGRLTSKETTLLRAVFSKWPKDFQNDVLDLLLTPFTESKGRPKVGEIRILKKSLDDTVPRLEVKDVDIDETDRIEFYAFARGVTADETMSAEDMNAVGDWFESHGIDVTDEPYHSVREALETGDPIKVFMALKSIQSLPWES